MVTLYRSGAIHAPQHLHATALVVEGGTIAWIGGDDEARRHADAVDEVVDLEGALVTPGFVDSHVHLSQTGAALRGVDLSTARSAAETLTRIAAAVRADPGRAVFAPNWEELRWPERAPMSAAELDRAAEGAFVYALRIDGHSAVISSSLAAASGAPNLPGWREDGLVTKDAHHAARAAFNANVTVAQRGDDIGLALSSAAAAGIVSVHENGGPHVSSADDLADALEAGRRPGTPHVVGYWAQAVTDEREARDLAAVHGVAGLAGDLNVDGSIGSRTARLYADYADAPGCRGNAYLSRQQVRDHVAACTLAGLQAGFHVIGDEAVATVVDAMDDAARLTGIDAMRAARHRLEHVEMIDGEGVARLARLGVAASVQPAFDAFWGGEDGMYAARLGPERVTGMNPYAAMCASGMSLALGSDSPVTPFAPWEAVRACEQHNDPEQRITLTEAFAAHTDGGWRAARLDGRGRLEVGGPATFVVWRASRLATDGATPLPDLSPGIPTPEALRTVVDGVVAHDTMG